MSMDEVARLKTFAMINQLDPVRRAEVIDAQWSDFGRMVSNRIFDPEFVRIVTRAALKAKTTMEHTAMIRAYLLSGARP